MATRNLGFVGAVALLLLGVVAMRGFLREEPAPTVQSESDDRPALVTDAVDVDAPAPVMDVDDIAMPAPIIEPSKSIPVGAAAPQVIQADRGGYELVRIHGGTFKMGSPTAAEGRWAAEGPQHEVTVPDFYIGRYEVTNKEYGRFLEANPEVRAPPWWNDPRFNQPQQPVVAVSWDEAQLYCLWAGLRLPTEAEWEYACRARSTGERYGALDDIAWYGENSEYELKPIGQKQPNAWSVHDMLGNALEWCQDSWYDSYVGAPVDGTAREEPTTSRRVVRGGSWSDDAEDCRSARRGSWSAGGRYWNQGFRPAR